MERNVAINKNIINKTKMYKKKILKENLWCWTFMLPTIILYGMFLGWPIVSSWYYSMLDWSGLSTNITFVGLQNFKDVAKDPLFWNAYINSFEYMIKSVPLGLVLSLLIAVILNNPKLKGAAIYRTLFFLPVITTASIVGIIMVFIWGASGPVNAVLMNLKLIKIPVNWLGDAKMAMTTVVLIGVWKGLGIDMIYWLAGLQSIPTELYEAATVDGAGTIKTFFYITLPLILPIGAVIALLDTVNSLKVFDIIKTMTEGGPYYATDVVATYIYRYAFSSEVGLPRLGYACAAGVFFGITIMIVGTVTASLNKLVKAKSKL